MRSCDAFFRKRLRSWLSLAIPHLLTPATDPSPTSSLQQPTHPPPACKSTWENKQNLNKCFSPESPKWTHSPDTSLTKPWRQAFIRGLPGIMNLQTACNKNQYQNTIIVNFQASTLRTNIGLNVGTGMSSRNICWPINLPMAIPNDQVYTADCARAIGLPVIHTPERCVSLDLLLPVGFPFNCITRDSLLRMRKGLAHGAP